MVSVRFVLAIVPTVRMLVGLDTQQNGFRTSVRSYD
jgi:hypothetical protein